MPKIQATAFDADGMAEFLGHLDQIHLVGIHKSRPDVHGKYFGTHVDSAVEWAQAKNANGFGVYFTVNRVRNGFDGKPKKSDIVAARYIHVDIDPPRTMEHDFSVAATIETLDNLRHPPTFVIGSGNGLQAFWALDDDCQNLESIERINMQVRGMFSADACQNIDRLMRLPGAINWPSPTKEARGRKPAMATMLSDHTGQTYQPEELAAFFPPAEQPIASERASVEVGEYELLTADDLHLTPFHPLRRALERPQGADRSAFGYHAACEAVREHLTDAQIAGLLLNPANPGGAHFIDQEHPLRAVKRAIGRARGVEEVDEADGPIPEVDFTRLVANAVAKVHATPQTSELVETQGNAGFDWYGPLKGGMREMVDTILSCAPKPRPELALGAAISLFATAAGRRYQSPTGILTNVYCVGLMASGSGKDFPLRAAGNVLTLAGLEDCVGGRIVSATGIRTALERNPTLFLPIDEFGKLIQAMNAKHGPLHDAVDMMLQLYSEAQGFAKGGMYANAQDRQTVLIHAPCLSIFGVATPASFWGGLTHASVVDGFLPRMILFQDDMPDSKSDRQREFAKARYSDTLVEAVRAVREGAEGHITFGMGDGSSISPKPYVVNFADREAQDFWWDMDDMQWEYRQRLPEIQHPFANRLLENATKLALIKAVSERPARPLLELPDLQWGYHISKRSIDAFLVESEKNMSENEHEARLKRVLDVVQQCAGNGAPLSHIGKKLQSIPSRERQSILEDLTEQGLVRVETDKTGGRPKYTYYAT